MYLESLFFFYYVFHKRSFQSPGHRNHTAKNAQQRITLLKSILSTTYLTNPRKEVNIEDDSKISRFPNAFQALEEELKLQHRIRLAREMFSQWFCGANMQDVYMKNAEIFCAFAWFDKELEELDNVELEELKIVIEVMRKELGLEPLKAGFNKKVKCFRPGLDPVRTQQRPLLYYLITYIIHCISHNGLKSLGFIRDRIAIHNHSFYFYKRIPANPDPSVHPIVFIHGLGLGFMQYQRFIARLPRSTPVYLIEQPHIIMRLGSHNIPTIPETVEFYHRLLHNPTSNSSTPACFVAHSFGSTAISWLLHPPQGNGSIVASVVLIDPITLLVCDATVVNNFLRRKPRVLLELLMDYFLAREMHIAKTLSRHFSWSWNILFAEELARVGKTPHIPLRFGTEIQINSHEPSSPITSLSPPPHQQTHQPQIKSHVILCNRDRIVPTHKIKRYITEFNKHVDARNDDFFEKVGLAWLDGFGHGEGFFKKMGLDLILKIVGEASGVRDESGCVKKVD
ncbi:hypothetical protein HK098_001796 [Nowakowskiella sp. JEL0407]|nr:hypothetical protein HK098_001796 [Nowakowskiella sp. JEL0407]